MDRKSTAPTSAYYDEEPSSLGFNEDKIAPFTSDDDTEAGGNSRGSGWQRLTLVLRRLRGSRSTEYSLINENPARDLKSEIEIVAVPAISLSYKFKYIREHMVLWIVLSTIALFILWSFSRTQDCAPAWKDVKALRCHQEAGRRKLDALLARQSRTPALAAARYKEKYGRDPPPGFEVWASFAIRHESLIIDDYDQLEADLKPFREIPSWVLRARIEAAIRSGKVARASVMNGSAIIAPEGDHQAARTTEMLLAPIVPFLPDLVFPINWGDGQLVQGPTHPISEDNIDRVSFHSIPREQAWDMLHANCPNSALSKSSISSDRPTIDVRKGHGDPQFRSKHGLYNSAASMCNTSLPIISMGKFSTFHDIPGPPWCYGSGNYRTSLSTKAPSFLEKQPILYWRGSMTGISGLGLSNWVHNHRLRIIARLSDMQRSVSQSPLLKHRKEGNFTRLSDDEQARLDELGLLRLDARQQSSISRLAPNSIDVGFTHNRICSQDDQVKQPSVCSSLNDLFPSKERMSPSNSLNYQFLLDLDGNGMSCRFYRLLDSGGVVFKQTAWTEWHDDRIVPYVHYVPIDISANEIPAYLDMMTNSAEGAILARTIADDGKEWASSVLRKIDISIAYYRLLLELSSILTDG